nr:MAG TPA: hypothetical protein [Bacteriophage sp.]
MLLFYKNSQCRERINRQCQPVSLHRIKIRRT